MKKILNIFIVLIMFLYVINIFNMSVSFAAINPNDYRPGDVTMESDAIQIANKVIGAFQAIGNIVSIVALILIGIKYMTSSVEQKAEYKETMINYIIGAILVFAISNISALIYDFAKKL